MEVCENLVQVVRAIAETPEPPFGCIVTHGVEACPREPWILDKQFGLQEAFDNEACQVHCPVRTRILLRPPYAWASAKRWFANASTCESARSLPEKEPRAGYLPLALASLPSQAPKPTNPEAAPEKKRDKALAFFEELLFYTGSAVPFEERGPLMAFDISVISPQARADYIRVGRNWGSKDTLAQANDTLQALTRYGSELVLFGFAAEDGKTLALVRDALQEATLGRFYAEASKKATSKAYLDAMRAGKNARLAARSVLSNVERILRDKAVPAHEGSLRGLGLALMKTQSAGADDHKLLEQLEILAECLRDSVIRDEAATRGGPESLREIEAAIVNIRDWAQSRTIKRGTPAETEMLDLLDGIIVSLARSARRAARIAAVRAGSPALAKAFELSRLYTTRSQSSSTSIQEPPAPLDKGAGVCE